jgi:hypothetical protein
MSLVLPPLVALTNPTLLAYSGGPSTVGHILDWREMASRPTLPSSAFHGLLDFSASESLSKLRGAWAGGKNVGEVIDESGEGGEGGAAAETELSKHDIEDWDLGVDDFRGWLIAFAWILAAAVESAAALDDPSRADAQHRAAVLSHPSADAHTRLFAHAHTHTPHPDVVFRQGVPDEHLLVGRNGVGGGDDDHGRRASKY